MTSLNTELQQTKNVWNILKPFLTNTGHFNHHDIMIFDGTKITTNGTELVEVVNNRYINVQKQSSRGVL